MKMGVSGNILSKIVSIITQRVSNGLVPESTINELAGLVSTVTADYLCFNAKEVDKVIDNQRNESPKPRPVIYIPIFENTAASMGIFYLRYPHSIIPLHDHPGITGLIKVIYGSAKVLQISAEQDPEATNFWRLSEMRTLVAKHCDTDAVLQVRPKKFNFHEITPYNAPGDGQSTGMAFFDVLFPPYDPPGGRDCSYYELCAAGTVANRTAQFIRRLPEPSQITRDDIFEAGFGPYYGPNV